MMPRDDIEELQEENKKLLDSITTASCFIGMLQEDCKTLVKKLLEVKPELEEWVKLNFGEYL